MAITAIVLLGIGGLFGIDWERREIDKYLLAEGTSLNRDNEPLALTCTAREPMKTKAPRVRRWFLLAASSGC